MTREERRWALSHLEHVKMVNLRARKDLIESQRLIDMLEKLLEKEKKFICEYELIVNDKQIVKNNINVKLSQSEKLDKKKHELYKNEFANITVRQKLQGFEESGLLKSYQKDKFSPKTYSLRKDF